MFFRVLHKVLYRKNSKTRFLRHRGNVELWISELFIQCNTERYYEFITGVGNILIFIWVCYSTSICLCSVPKNHIISPTSVNLTQCYIQYAARFLWYYGTNAWQDICRSIISLSRITLNLTWSPIQPKKQGNKATKFEKGREKAT